LLDINNEKLSEYEDEHGINIRRCLVSGFFANTAKQHKGGMYKTTKTNYAVLIHPSCYLFKEDPKWVLYNELVLTSKEFMRYAVEIEPNWLLEIAPHYIKQDDLLDDTEKESKLSKIAKMADKRENFLKKRKNISK
jgi:pre-mRNA-splicing factor ATP-dependent RNA helicase DHX16